MDKESVLFGRLEVVTTPYPSIENAGRSEYCNHLFPQSIYTNAKKDAIGNPIVKKSLEDRIARSLEQVALVEAVNIQSSYNSSSGPCLVINVSKFGASWRLLQVEVVS